MLSVFGNNDLAGGGSWRCRWRIPCGRRTGGGGAGRRRQQHHRHCEMGRHQGGPGPPSGLLSASCPICLRYVFSAHFLQGPLEARALRQHGGPRLQGRPEGEATLPMLHGCPLNLPIPQQKPPFPNNNMLWILLLGSITTHYLLHFGTRVGTGWGRLYDEGCLSHM